MIATALAIGVSGAVWSGCGGDDSDNVTDQVTDAINQAQKQAQQLQQQYGK